MKNDLGTRRGKNLREPRSFGLGKLDCSVNGSARHDTEVHRPVFYQGTRLNGVSEAPPTYVHETHMEKAAQKGSRSCGKTSRRLFRRSSGVNLTSVFCAGQDDQKLRRAALSLEKSWMCSEALWGLHLHSHYFRRFVDVFLAASIALNH